MYIIYKSCKCVSIENVSDVFTELKKVENILVMLFEKRIECNVLYVSIAIVDLIDKRLLS